ncbi:MAG: MoxR family ATPase [Clostridia bacterium]|nr:MoxR family ATPase [Clostridia bacterium]
MNEQTVSGRDKLIAMADEIEKVIVGKRQQIIFLMTALLSGGHVLIEDVPGTGKTTLAAALATVCGLSFKRAQFTPDVMASDITGFNMYNRQKEQFEFIEGLAMCNILLADEINRASPKTQSALLEAMEEGNVTVDGKSYPLPDPFFVIATQNPTGFVGTYPLPEAQLDRFSIRLSLGYPQKEEEVRIISERHGKNPLDDVRTLTNAEELKSIIKNVSEVFVEDRIYGYIVDLVAQTRKHGDLILGASTRASLIISKMAQATAFVAGRNYVVPEDVAAVFVPVTAHRIMLKREAKLSGTTPEKVLYDILKRTSVPTV